MAKKLGELEFFIDFEAVKVTHSSIEKMEALLSRTEWVKSPLLRIDCSLHCSLRENGEIYEVAPELAYEIEQAPGGLWMLGLLLGWEHLKNVLPANVVAVCTFPHFQEAYRLLENLGWEILYDPEALKTLPEDVLVYWSVTPEETDQYSEDILRPLAAQGRLLVDPWADKGKIVEWTGGEVVFSPAPSIEEVTRRYPDGFVIKPLRGWGSKGVEVSPPRDSVWWGKRSTLSALRRALESPGGVIVQPFIPPIALDGQWWGIARLYFFKNLNNSYFYLGGIVNLIPDGASLRVHGRSDAVFRSVELV